jgi:hypothetical protein
LNEFRENEFTHKLNQAAETLYDDYKNTKTPGLPSFPLKICGAENKLLPFDKKREFAVEKK